MDRPIAQMKRSLWPLADIAGGAARETHPGIHALDSTYK
jgi:hypothetical protein